MGTMSEDMRQEMNEVKTRLSGVETRLSGVETRLSGVETRLDHVETKLDRVDVRLTTVEKTTRSIAIVVAGHTEALGRIEKQLTKLDELDGFKKSLEVFTSEIIASRHARTLTDKSFFDQQSTLSDHELRLTRIELKDRQS